MTEGKGGREKREIREDRKVDQMNEEVGRGINHPVFHLQSLHFHSGIPGIYLQIDGKAGNKWLIFSWQLWRAKGNDRIWAFMYWFMAMLIYHRDKCGALEHDCDRMIRGSGFRRSGDRKLSGIETKITDPANSTLPLLFVCFWPLFKIHALLPSPSLSSFHSAINKSTSCCNN